MRFATTSSSCDQKVSQVECAYHFIKYAEISWYIFSAGNWAWVVYSTFFSSLDVLETGDHRDAIVYKSEQRAILQSDFDIVGAVGDQWSDFTGMPRPVSVFKLPNPFYYIL